MVSTQLSRQEFLLLQRFIQDYCGIQIPESKAYLLHSRLEKLLAEEGIKNYLSLYAMLRQPGKNQMLAQKVIDAITIKETYWFRDKSPWLILDEVLMPAYISKLRTGRQSKVRIWSAACSTGQEPYSVMMCIDHHLRQQQIKELSLKNFEILATDISPTVLETAQKGSYDSISLNRGLGDYYKENYFEQKGRFWTIKQKIKDRISFQPFNLCKSFAAVGTFDLILCRYVTIYFPADLSREIFNKLATALNPGGVLLLGNAEIFSDYKSHFLLKNYKDGVFYSKRDFSRRGEEYEHTGC